MRRPLIISGWAIWNTGVVNHTHGAEAAVLNLVKIGILKNSQVFFRANHLLDFCFADVLLPFKCYFLAMF